MNIVLRLLGPILLGLVALIMIIAIANYNIDLMFVLTRALLILAVVGVLAAFVLQVVTNYKSIITFGIGAVILLVLYFIARAVSGPTTAEVTMYAKKGLAESNLVFVGGIITLGFWLIILAFVAWIASEILKIIR